MWLCHLCDAYMNYFHCKINLFNNCQTDRDESSMYNMLHQFNRSFARKALKLTRSL
jgi:hypothetical protein